MAITDIAAYAHLSPTDIEAFGAELDQIRRDVEESRGAKDAAYIRRTITFQRTLDVACASAHRRQPVEGRWVAGHRGAGLSRSASRTWNSATTSATASGIG